MKDPTVTFVVPCYKLGHLLPDCINSILCQTFGDFEILVMDDCSPDETPEVARSFGDPRVVHVRNEPNLGHLRNYNKGIGLARGRYVWLISADDYLRRPHVLERYIGVLEHDPRVGYAFCAGVGVRDGVETAVLDYSVVSNRDRVIAGRTWLKRLVRQNVVLTASGLVRRECYERHGAFPLDMPWAGDWYLWCLFALYHDVAYFAEPMVCYREHALSMTRKLNREQALACCTEEIAMQWDIMRRAEREGLGDLSRACLRMLSYQYAECAIGCRFGTKSPVMTMEDVEASLSQHVKSASEMEVMRALFYESMGDEQCRRGDLQTARHLYRTALEKQPWSARVLAKRLLLRFGRPGAKLRKILRTAAGN